MKTAAAGGHVQLLWRRQGPPGPGASWTVLQTAELSALAPPSPHFEAAWEQESAASTAQRAAWHDLSTTAPCTEPCFPPCPDLSAAYGAPVALPSGMQPVQR